MSSSLSLEVLTKRFQQIEENIKNGNTKPEDLDVLVDGALSSESAVAWKSIFTIRTIRKLLCDEKFCPFSDATMTELVPCFVTLLRKSQIHCQVEVSWALANICAHSSAATTCIIEEGALPIFVDLLESSEHPSVRLQAAWALGNVAAHSIEYRDLILEHKALTPLVKAITFPERYYIWAVHNLFCLKPLPPQLKIDEVKDAVQRLEKYINDHDYEVVKHVSLVLAYISEEDDKIEAVHEAQGICGGLVRLLMYSCEDVIFHALKTIGNIVSAGGEGKQRIIDHQALLPNLATLLRKNYRLSIVRDACRIISKTIAGNRKQIQNFIKTDGIRTLVSLTNSGRDDEIKRAALDVVSKATSGGCSEQITYLIPEGCTTESTGKTTTESPNPRSKSLYMNYGMHTTYGGTTHPFMKKEEDGGGDSLPVDDIVNMGVFVLNSQVYMIAGKRTPGKRKAEDFVFGPMVSDAVYVIDRKEGDDERLHLCRPNEDVPPLPIEFYSIPIVVKIREEIYVLYAGHGPTPIETFFVLRRSNCGNSWGWKSLPPPPFYLGRHIYPHPYSGQCPNVMGVVGTKLWVSTNEAVHFYDVETEAWGWGHCPDKCRYNAATLSITGSADGRSRNYVVIGTTGGTLPYVHAVLVSESGEVLCYQVIDDGQQGLPVSSEIRDLTIEVVELECDGSNCSTFGVLFYDYKTLIVKVWTVSLLMGTGIGSSEGGATLSRKKVKPLELAYFVQFEQAVSKDKQFLNVEPKGQQTYHDLAGFTSRAYMFFK